MVLEGEKVSIQSFREFFRSQRFDIHEDEARTVPNLIREVFEFLKTSAVEVDLSCLRCTGGKRHPHGVCAISIDDLDGVDDIPFCFRHLFPFRMNFRRDRLAKIEV